MLGASVVELYYFPPYSSSCVEFNHISSRDRVSLEFQKKEHRVSLSCALYRKVVCSTVMRRDGATTLVSKTHTAGALFTVFL